MAHPVRPGALPCAPAADASMAFVTLTRFVRLWVHCCGRGLHRHDFEFREKLYDLMRTPLFTLD